MAASKQFVRISEGETEPGECISSRLISDLNQCVDVAKNHLCKHKLRSLSFPGGYTLQGINPDSYSWTRFRLAPIYVPDGHDTFSFACCAKSSADQSAAFGVTLVSADRFYDQSDDAAITEVELGYYSMATIYITNTSYKNYRSIDCGTICRDKNGLTYFMIMITSDGYPGSSGTMLSMDIW